MSVWFHGASLGELEHARGIWEHIAEFGVTYTSKSVGEKTDSRALFWDRLRGGFWPSSGNRGQVEMLVTMVNEIQPFLILKNRDIPWVVSDCHTCGTLVHHPLKKLLTRAVRIFCQTEQDAEKLAVFEPIVNGNCRVDRVLERADRLRQNESSFQEEWFSHYGNKVLVLGSVYPEDFNVIHDDPVKLQREGWGIVIAPHHFDQKFSSYFTKTQNYSEKRWDPKISVVMVDVFGKLFSLYRHANVVYVGSKKRIHSILEPAAFGVKLLGAPRYFNAPEAIQMKQEGFFLPMYETGQLYRAVLEPPMKNPKIWMERSRGAGRRVADFIISTQRK